MCLLAISHLPHEEVPLVALANRDEFYERPALGPRVLDAEPRVVGGLDLRGGGTWLAIGAQGLLIGVTNWPLPGGPNPGRHSRGALVRSLAHEPSAEAAARRLQAIDGQRYNPCFLVIADRRGVWHAQLDPQGRVEVLPWTSPEWLVLENAPLLASTAKTRRVRHLLATVGRPRTASELRDLLPVLTDHAQPVPTEAGGRPPALLAACVHTDAFGTRSGALMALDRIGHVTYLASEGPPCRSALADYSALAA